MITSLTNGILKIEIAHLGAELQCIQDANERDYLWNGNPDFWGKRAPVLFPIVGTLRNNQYQHNNKTYTLNRHGFARELLFNLIEKTNTKAVFLLQTNEQSYLNYPFDFELVIAYNLNHSKLEIEYLVRNKSNEIMPFSIGGHPAFSLPKPFHSYELHFEFPEILTYSLLENDLVSNETLFLAANENKLPLSYSLFENDALIIKEMKSKKITLVEEQNPILSFHYRDFKNFGIWTKTNAPFICLEPWLGFADTVNSNGILAEKEGIIILQPNAAYNCNYAIEII